MELREPPQNAVAEQSVLGSCMLDPEAIDTASEILRPEHFFFEKHQLVFTAMTEMREKFRKVDSITLAEQLEKQKCLADVGGVPYLLELMAAVPHGGFIDYHAKIVLDMSRRRKALEAAMEIVRSAHDLAADTNEMLAASEGRLHEAISHGEAKFDMTIEAALMEAMVELERPPEEGQAPGGTVDIMIPSADHIIGGMKPGNLIILAASAGVGKTSIAMNLLTANAGIGIPGAFFSYEMKRSEICERLWMSMMSNITLRQLTRNEMTPEERMELLQVSERLSKLPLLIDDRDFALPQLLSTMRTAARKYGTKIFVIDYLQIVPSGEKFRPGEREREVATIVDKLKKAAKALNVIVIALSQLNRDVDKRENKKPKLSDLRESGAIEQFADKVLMLWRPNKGQVGLGPDEQDDHAFLIVAKNRRGTDGETKLHWNGARTTYTDWIGDWGTSSPDPAESKEIRNWQDGD